MEVAREAVTGETLDSFFHSQKLGDPILDDGVNIVSRGVVVDRWHTHGNANMFKNDENRNVLDLVKQRLPRIELPIYIGSTGYIELSTFINTHANCWCTDQLGRVVFVVDDVLYFQRYENGDRIMKGPLSKTCFNDLCDQEDIANVRHRLSA
jgi:hypothetical protein